MKTKIYILQTPSGICKNGFQTGFYNAVLYDEERFKKGVRWLCGKYNISIETSKYNNNGNVVDVGVIQTCRFPKLIRKLKSVKERIISDQIRWDKNHKKLTNTLNISGSESDGLGPLNFDINHKFYVGLCDELALLKFIQENPYEKLFVTDSHTMEL